MNYKERVGNNIRYYREANGLTLKDVASKIGITEATMQKYEVGQIKRVDVEMIVNIASAIGVTAQQITGWISKDDEISAHENRIKERNNKWINLYEKMPFNKQKVVNELISQLSSGGINNLEEKLISAFWKASEKDIRTVCSALDLDPSEFLVEKKDGNIKEGTR